MWLPFTPTIPPPPPPLPPPSPLEETPSLQRARSLAIRVPFRIAYIGLPDQVNSDKLGSSALGPPPAHSPSRSTDPHTSTPDFPNFWLPNFQSRVALAGRGQRDLSLAYSALLYFHLNRRDIGGAPLLIPRIASAMHLTTPTSMASPRAQSPLDTYANATKPLSSPSSVRGECRDPGFPARA